MSILKRREEKNIKDQRENIVEYFMELYNEMYGDPSYSNSVSREVLVDEEITEIYENYEGFENISFDELTDKLGKTYYIDFGHQDSY